MPRQRASSGGSGLSAKLGDWVIGYDNSGKAYLFVEGTYTRFGGTASAAGLANFIDLGTSDVGIMSQRLGTAMARLQLPVNQTSALMQSVDVGSIEQGGTYVAIPRSVAAQGAPADPSQGQAPSGSSAVFAPIIPGSSVVSSVSAAITGTVDFLAWIAWIFHPLNLLRAVEFLTGLAAMFYGLSTILGVMRRGSRTHRTSIVGSLAATFIRKKPTRVDHVAAGRESGRRQGERDVAYREARREVLRGSSNPPQERRVRAASRNGNE